MKTLWTSGWFGLYGPSGLIAIEHSKADNLPSPAREVALASLYYTARNKHRAALLNPLEWLTLVLPLFHIMTIRKHEEEALIYARAVHKTHKGFDGEGYDLTAGGHDVVGTILALQDPETAVEHLLAAAHATQTGDRPSHERALPIARVALLSVQKPGSCKLDHEKIEEMVHEAYDLARKSKNAAQSSRVFALLAEYYWWRGSMSAARQAVDHGLDCAKSCGARTQVAHLNWLLTKMDLSPQRDVK